MNWLNGQGVCQIIEVLVNIIDSPQKCARNEKAYVLNIYINVARSYNDNFCILLIVIT